MKRSILATILSIATFSTVLLPYSEADATRWQSRREGWLAGRAMKAEGYRLTDATTGFLGYRRSTFVKVYMFKGVETGIFVAGCQDAKRIGIDIYDPKGLHVTSDNRPTHRPYQHIKPGMTGWYWVRINMVESTPNGAHYSVVLGNK